MILNDRQQFLPDQPRPIEHPSIKEGIERHHEGAELTFALLGDHDAALGVVHVAQKSFRLDSPGGT